MYAKMYNAWRGAHNQLPLFDLLLATDDLRASHPEGRVWGLLGIKMRDSDPDGDLLLKPDLSLKPGEMYERVARKVLAQGDLRCLALVDRSKYEEPWDHRLEGMASWVPNFARKKATFLPALGFRAHGDTQVRMNLSCPRPHCVAFEGHSS